MAGHVQDRWFKTEVGPGGSVRRVKTDRHGKGLRYRARYVLADGTERSQSFPDKQKRNAEAWLARIEADLSRGQFIDPAAGKVTFKQYATDWLASQTSNASSIEATELRLRLHAFPHLGHHPMSVFQPSHIRQWARALQDSGLAGSYQRVIFANVSAVFSAAVDDAVIHRNPCRAGSVKTPKPDPRKVRPWPRERVLAVREALPAEYSAAVDVGAGCGLRQGEIFGLAVDEVDFLGGVVHVVRQVKIVGSKLVFAPPKGDKLRDVPLPDAVAFALAQHITSRPPIDVTLPWKTPEGQPVTVSLLFYSRERKALNRNYFNPFLWKPALVAAGVIGKRSEPAREHGMHALRHFYASVLLDAGENIKALAEYLGHADPGFTLRTYTHLMPNSPLRTREAIDQVFRSGGGTDAPSVPARGGHPARQAGAGEKARGRRPRVPRNSTGDGPSTAQGTA